MSKRSRSHHGGNNKKGGMSKRDKKKLEEYGHLNQPFEEQEEHPSLFGSFEGKTKHVIDETLELKKSKGNKLRRGKKGGNVQSESDQVIKKKESLNGGEEEESDNDDEWKAASSYNSLLNSLKREGTSKYHTLFKKIKLEGEGKEEEITTLNEKKKVKENGSQILKNEEEENDHNVKKMKEKSDSNDISQEREEEDVTQSDEENEEEGEELSETELKETEEHDEFTVHFDEEFTTDIKETLELFKENNEKWSSQSYIDPILDKVTVYDVLEVDENDLSETKLSTLDDFMVKKRLQTEWQEVNKQCILKTQEQKGKKKGKGKKEVEENGIDNQPHFTDFQKKLFDLIHKYKDVFLTTSRYENSVEIRNLCALHSVNHIFKTRDRVLKNSNKLNKLLKEQPNHDVEERDQGFTRPKVLVIFPLKNDAYHFIKTIISLSSKKGAVENRKRFETEFTEEDDEPLHDGKPEDWRQTFEGNIDDCYKIGIKFTRKSMKLFSDFYSSDIIVASPLGLRMIIGAEGEKDRDFDFLSSIEVTIINQTDVILMQNWDHLLHVLDHTNLIPKENKGSDFSRIRNWVLDGLSSNVRQTIMLGSYIFPESTSLFNSLLNYAGKIKITSSSQKGVISQVILQVPQMFHKMKSSKLAEMNNIKFNYFKEKILPDIKDSLLSKRTCIFFSSYFEFVRVRNYFKELEMNYKSICEYTSNSDVSRNRSWFFHGQVDIILYTERFHFFRRPKMRGMKHIIFYDLPENGLFYSELLNLLSGDDISSTCLFSTFDWMKLERIVGSERAQRMVQSQKPTFMFV